VNPLVSVIISTRNRFEEFQTCLDTVHTFTDVPYEVIIIDAGSTDQTREWLIENEEEYNLALLLSPPIPGYTSGNNMAMKTAKGKYIYLLNNDNWVTEGWIKPMIDLYEKDPTIGHMSSVILWPDRKIQSAGANITKDGASVSLHSGAPYEKVKDMEPFVCDYAGFGLYRKDVAEQVGYLSECYYPIYFDDPDYAFKVKTQLGLKTVCCPKSVIYHACSPSDREHHSDAYSRNHKIFMERWSGFLARR